MSTEAEFLKGFPIKTCSGGLHILGSVLFMINRSFMPNPQSHNHGNALAVPEPD